ncbi:hypothetical protein GCM10023342_08140 [Modicisalibacter zincidurans]|uniref:Ribonuclease R n=1 Tax=Modicisalibacter zincidurans TaxID=1178777 RepID=A0ABP9R706_9GAMM
MNHWTLSDDPQAAREADKYDKPVPSREYLLARLEEYGKPITDESMSRMLGLEDDNQQEAVRRRLAAMERDGQILRNRRGAYALIDKLDLIKGKVLGHRDGIGFLLRDDGKKPDLVIPPRQMRRVFHGDHVLVRVSGRDRRGRDEATIVEVLARNTQTLVGVYRARSNEFGVLIPENTRIAQEVIVPNSATGGAQDGQVVSVRITQQPETRVQPVGEVVEVLGERMDPGMEIDIAIRSYEIPSEFPPDVQDEIASMSAEVAEADKQHRIDLRDVPLVTIDDESAKDFDDAVCAWKTKSGSWKLLVAIADVSHYVRPGSALDQEAISRGNSVYFPGQVVPMLPELLSNGLCSLNPDVDRLALVCEMNISQSGAISRYRFYEGVFRSHARLTYNKVAAILDGDDAEADTLREQYSALVPSLNNLHTLYMLLREARVERGAIDFETTETAILFNDERKIEAIVPRSRNDAHKIIEECMLAANVATARFLDKHDLPALYRIHEKPSPERLDKLRLFLNELGLSLGGGDDPSPQDYRDLAEAIKGRPDADVIQTVMLRSMSRAVYSPQNDGHFGLAYPAYAHFTSPIRRYPDLLVHRAIRSVIRGPRQTNTVLRAEQVGAVHLRADARARRALLDDRAACRRRHPRRHRLAQVRVHVRQDRRGIRRHHRLGDPVRHLRAPRRGVCRGAGACHLAALRLLSLRGGKASPQGRAQRHGLPARRWRHRAGGTGRSRRAQDRFRAGRRQAAPPAPAAQARGGLRSRPERQARPQEIAAAQAAPRQAGARRRLRRQ